MNRKKHSQTTTENFSRLEKNVKISIIIIFYVLYFYILGWPIRRRLEQKKRRKYMTWLWNRKRKWKKPKNQVSVLKRFLSRNIFIFQGFQIIREAPEDLLESIGWQVEERSNFLFHSILLSSESSSNARHNGVTKKSKVRYFTFV